MTDSVNSSSIIKMAVLSIMVSLLAACALNHQDLRQINDDTAYLQATELKELAVPVGFILPLQNGNYDIPVTVSNGALGKQLDIRPPEQPLALINESSAQLNENTAKLILKNQQNSVLWARILKVMALNQFPIADHQNSSQQFITDWIVWHRADEDYPYRGRYQVNVQQQDYQQVLNVHLLQLQQQDKDINTSAEIQRYTVQMLNTLSMGLNSIEDKQVTESNQSTSQIDVRSGADETGLPNLIVHAPYAVVWQRLPEVLKHVGMEVTNSSHSQSSLAVTYQSLGDSRWNEWGVKNPELPEGKYKLLIGDLDNRTSLQFIDPNEHVLTQSQNDVLIDVFKAVFKK